mmetsp:Transcript_11145/g.29659  ORF Transcript_11145/g.29659 Transcript_11145/m.29659 type:complete len:236 (-) Transcript_11145:973-1680(-)
MPTSPPAGVLCVLVLDDCPISILVNNDALAAGRVGDGRTASGTCGTSIPAWGQAAPSPLRCPRTRRRRDRHGRAARGTASRHVVWRVPGCGRAQPRRRSATQMHRAQQASEELQGSQMSRRGFALAAAKAPQILVHKTDGCGEIGSANVVVYTEVMPTASKGVQHARKRPLMATVLPPGRRNGGPVSVRQHGPKLCHSGGPTTGDNAADAVAANGASNGTAAISGATAADVAPML